MDKAFILGVPITVATPNELSKAIRRLLYRRRGHIVTPNPEFLLLAQKHQEFFSVLENADLSIPDGIGLKFAGWLKGVNLHRYSGSNLVKYLLDIANQKRGRVAVANWRKGLSTNEEIVEAIKKIHPHLKTYVFSLDRDNFSYDVKRLKQFQPDIVFVALGAPSQDIFIRSRLLKELPSIRLAMGVGGSFDFLTGKLKRAPSIIQLLGFEWLWRLIKQPWRIKRIFNAVVVFPLSVIEWEIRRFRYRKNVAAFIVNKNNEVLLLNRTHFPSPHYG
jgi:N-acetylglucosaminyldiphosphoundecaprenol N-acetyl-beta-D-mannosaminyltransferase